MAKLDVGSAGAEAKMRIGSMHGGQPACMIVLTLAGAAPMHADLTRIMRDHGLRDLYVDVVVSFHCWWASRGHDVMPLCVMRRRDPR